MRRRGLLNTGAWSQLHAQRLPSGSVNWKQMGVAPLIARRKRNKILHGRFGRTTKPPFRRLLTNVGGNRTRPRNEYATVAGPRRAASVSTYTWIAPSAACLRTRLPRRRSVFVLLVAKKHGGSVSRSCPSQSRISSSARPGRQCAAQPGHFFHSWEYIRDCMALALQRRNRVEDNGSYVSFPPTGNGFGVASRRAGACSSQNGPRRSGQLMTNKAGERFT